LVNHATKIGNCKYALNQNRRQNIPQTTMKSNFTLHLFLDGKRNMMKTRQHFRWANRLAVRLRPIDLKTQQI
jgi:hypothetical protein